MRIDCAIDANFAVIFANLILAIPCWILFIFIFPLDMDGLMYLLIGLIIIDLIVWVVIYKIKTLERNKEKDGIDE